MVSFKTTDGDGEEITTFSKDFFIANMGSLQLRESIKSDRILYFVESNAILASYKVFKGDYFELLK